MAEHPITTPSPPQDKFKQWEDDILNERENVDVVLDCTWKDGYRAGADAQLEACCEWVNSTGWEGAGDSLRKHCRPKPPSLAEEAQRILVENGRTFGGCVELDFEDVVIIHRALKRLQELENNG